jgi:allantoin racemase
MSSEDHANRRPSQTQRVVALLNPNTSTATTDALHSALAEGLARRPDLHVSSYTARRGPPMITDTPALDASVTEVLALAAMAVEDLRQCLAAVVVGAFGDPGVTQLRSLLRVPVLGLAESGIEAAARDGRRFGIATTTPKLRVAMTRRVESAGVGNQFTGFQFTEDDDILELSRQPDRLADSLETAARRCVERDGAQCVVIGGGPLSTAAKTLAARLNFPVVIPIAEAARALAGLPRTPARW